MHTEDEKIVLSVEEPFIEVYPIFANPLSILMNHKKTYGWLLNNFLQLSSNSEALNFYDFNYKLCPFLIVQKISKKYLKNQRINIIDFIIEALSKKQYVYCLVKQKYINAYSIKDDVVHDIFIYGVDIKRNIFYVADNFKNGKYSKEKCTFEEFIKAIENIEQEREKRLGFKGCIELLEFDMDEIQEFSKERVIDSLNDYLQGQPTGAWNNLEFRNQYGKLEWLYGIDCFKYMNKRIDDLKMGNGQIQDFHLFWEHKKQICRVIKYLIENEYIKDEKKYFEAVKISKNALIVRNLVLKYQVNKNDDLLNRMKQKYDEIYEEEICLLNEIINQLTWTDL